MIRCLAPDGLPVAVYAVEVDGECYALAEVERIIGAQQSDAVLTISVSGLQIACQARCDDGSTCGKRTYRGRPYCPKHWQRYVRHGDASVALKPWEKTVTKRPGRPKKKG